MLLAAVCLLLLWQAAVLRPLRAAPDGENMTVCYEPYGCFDNFYPWRDVNRPISYLPEDPEKIHANFCLLTRRNSNRCQYLSASDPNTLYRANVNQHDFTYVICHGYVENGRKSWIKALAGELLKNRDANVILVDWGEGAKPPYTQAVANTRLVGAVLAQLLASLRIVGVSSSAVHFIGHSLGAHIGGYAGLRLQTQHDLRLGRITGLDPAAPHFAGTAPEVRLDPSDADFVDVIHSDTSKFITGGFGMSEPCGHVDFYPNGGENQPGCDESIGSYFNLGAGFVEGIRRLIGCNHIRSYEYFTESVNPCANCSFLAAECGSWEEYRAGGCFPGPRGGGEAPMGLRADAWLRGRDLPPPRRGVKLFLATGGSPPYCRSQYLVRFQVSCSERSVKHNGEVGVLRLTVHGDSGNTASIRLFETGQYFAPGSAHQVLVPAGYVGNITALTLEWEYQTSLFNLLSWRIITTPRIYIDWLSVESLGPHRSSLKVCPPEDTALIAQIPAKLSGCSRETRDCRRSRDGISYRP
ncbi:pancreatic lipase-related protein 2-like [Bacillus rossius redtenbacheri]|uniref:pancreatic lipase-related protein 2-like n=1 Tax=Bacillus rossius redtenbacheri TaxID=93214 RepID=UPI002FDE3551